MAAKNLTKYRISSYTPIDEIRAQLQAAEVVLSGNKEFTFFEFPVVLWVAANIVVEHVAKSKSDDQLFTESLFNNDNLYSAVKNCRFGDVGGFECVGYDSGVVLSTLETQGYIEKHEG